MDKGGRKYFVNNQIRASKMLLIDEKGEKIWIYDKQTALSLAEDKGLDLIQVWYNKSEDVAVVKMMDYWKFMYQLKKQEKEKKKNQKVKGMKEIKISYNIGKKDLDVKLEKAKELLQEWYSIRFLWELRGRENIYKNKMFERLQEIEEILKEYGKSQWIKEERKWYSLILFAKAK